MDFLIAVLIIAAIGLLVGVLLAFSAKIFAVKKDEREEFIRELLPGANCGACGYSGGDGYAKALAKGETENVSLCSPGGNSVAGKLGEYLGLSAEEIIPHVACVRCVGTCETAQTKLEYSGVASCRLAMQLFDGHKVCRQGCLGFGDCVKACPYDAIFICNGIARVSTNLCHNCKACVNVCPKHCIQMIPLTKKVAAVMCNNREKGAVARKACKSACIACGKCERVCPVGAVKVVDNLAVIDENLCISCGKCAEGCPVKCIEMINQNFNA